MLHQVDEVDEKEEEKWAGRIKQEERLDAEFLQVATGEEG